jgi:hypothetical protein
MQYIKWYNWAVVILVVGVSFSTMLLFVIHVLNDYKTDTTPISNLGFAVLAALASLSFNWAKSFDSSIDEERQIIKHLNRAGSRAIFSSICFITASLSKYVFRDFDKIKVYLPFQGDFIKFLFGIGYLIPFSTAFILVFYVIARLSIIYLQTINIFKD